MSEDGEFSDWRHPADDLDDEDVNRWLELQKRFRFVIDRTVAFVLDAEDPEIAAWQVAFALESPHCLGMTMSQKAAELGIGKAAISKGATAFCRIVELPPSKYMLPESARDSYRKLREDQEKYRRENS